MDSGHSKKEEKSQHILYPSYSVFMPYSRSSLRNSVSLAGHVNSPQPCCQPLLTERERGRLVLDDLLISSLGICNLDPKDLVSVVGARSVLPSMFIQKRKEVVCRKAEKRR